MTGRYRKKPVVIEAFQMTRGRQAEVIGRWQRGKPDEVVTAPDSWPDWLSSAWNTGWLVIAGGFINPSLRIQTKEGPLFVKPDAWIIRGVQGEIYPCDPEIFAATYEAVGADEVPQGPSTRRSRLRLRRGAA